MKTIRLLFLLLTISAAIFYSCSDSNPIDNQTNAQESIALRTALNELKKANDISGRTAAENPFCFEFVFPITFTLSDGTAVTAANLEGLLDLLVNESNSLYLEGVEFPFQVMHGGAVVTVSNEAEFTALLEACGYSTWNDDLENTFCFDIVFPIQVTQNNQNITISSMQEFATYMNSPAAANEIQIVFPISVHYNGQTIAIHNLYEFYQMINNCDSCVCTQEYAPVCVQAADGTMLEFGNVCYAHCAGYSQNDLVACNPATDCDLFNLTITTGSCNSDGTYALTLDFDHVNAGSAHFEVHSGNGVLVGTYNLSDLPVTINHYPNANTGADYMTVNIVGNTVCSASNQWTIPNCNGCNCPTDFVPVCVIAATGSITQFDNACIAACHGFTANDFVTCGVAPNNFGTQLGSCFFMSYPVFVQHQGALVQVNSDSELLQYYFPASGPIPALQYPVTVTFANSVFTFADQASFQSHISAMCN
jgi:hypothetical protein